MTYSRITRGISGLALPVLLLIAWQLAALAKSSPLFPSPVAVALAIVDNGSVIFGEFGHTLWRALLGFVLASATMIPLGILLGRVRLLGRVLEPLMAMIATLPPPAVLPLALLFAGTGDAGKIALITYAAGVPLLMNTYQASHGIHPMMTRVARSLHLSRLETMALIDLPSSLPLIATGARLAIASSLLVSVTSEMLMATNGIGVFLQKSQENFAIDAGLAGIAFISLAGLVINALVLRLERRWLFWHYRSSDAGGK